MIYKTGFALLACVYVCVRECVEGGGACCRYGLA